MLKIVDAVLAELGVLPAQGVCGHHINLTTGDSLAISAFVTKNDFFQIRASEHRNLGAQYAALCSAWERFPRFIAQPVGYRWRDGWSVMVSRGISHRTVEVGDLRRARRNGLTLLDDALEFFASSRVSPWATHRCQSNAQSTLFQTLEKHFEATEYAAIAERCVRDARNAGAEEMAPLPQHGDLVVNNLGYAGDRLVIFDWEDFAQVELPGLDVFTLLMSLLDEEPARLSALLRAASDDARLDDFVARACASQGVAESLFRRLVPLYLLTFLYLKRTYGLEVQQRIGNLLVWIAGEQNGRDWAHEPGRASTSLQLPGCDISATAANRTVP